MNIDGKAVSLSVASFEILSCSISFKKPMQSSHQHSSFDLFNTQMAEEFDEDAFCEIEPLQLDEELTPLPSHCGKYLSDALGN